MAGGDLYSWLLNSFLVTALSVGISTALAALAAYPLSLMRWRAGLSSMPR
jgi:ABC-type sugar transport system, permease component